MYQKQYLKTIILTESQFKNILNFKNDEKYLPKQKVLLGNIFEGEIIDEAIFKTYDINFVLKHFERFLNFSRNYSIFATFPESYNGFITSVKGENNLDYIEFVCKDNDDLIKKATDAMKLCGYYMAFCEEYSKGFVCCGFEKLHEKNVQLNVKKLYHVTKRENKFKIKKIGLVPKNKNKKTYHTERIYFFIKDFGEKGFLRIAKQMFGSSDTGYIVCEINVDNLKDVNFHYDVNTMDGVYTTENIPPESIKIKYEF